MIYRKIRLASPFSVGEIVMKSRQIEKSKQKKSSGCAEQIYVLVQAQLKEQELEDCQKSPIIIREWFID